MSDEHSQSDQDKISIWRKITEFILGVLAIAGGLIFILQKPGIESFVALISILGTLVGYFAWRRQNIPYFYVVLILVAGFGTGVLATSYLYDEPPAVETVESLPNIIITVTPKLVSENALTEEVMPEEEPAEFQEQPIANSGTAASTVADTDYCINPQAADQQLRNEAESLEEIADQKVQEKRYPTAEVLYNCALDIYAKLVDKNSAIRVAKKLASVQEKLNRSPQVIEGLENYIQALEDGIAALNQDEIQEILQSYRQQLEWNLLYDEMSPQLDLE